MTGFLGRNGAGKTTTMRMILGLQRPTWGTVTIDGRAFTNLVTPLRHVGSLLDARAVQSGCSAPHRLLALACSNGIEARRVGEVLETVGLGNVGRKRAGTFSQGMLQRLGLAAALLGDPCQRPRQSPHRRPRELPADGHGFSPRTVTRTPQ